MSYATYDFSESLQRVSIEARDIQRVLAAWGHGNESTEHYRWAEDTGTEWSGGFLMLLRDGRYVYVTGWCDYTGWGCQDGATVRHYDAKPDLATLNADNEPSPDEWDIEPADLNKWVSDNAKEPE